MLGASFVLYRCFERPMTGLREKWGARAEVSMAFAAPGTAPLSRPNETA
jgi:peptidoglycan/LPS O-acetylase OafA/YrhL